MLRWLTAVCLCLVTNTSFAQEVDAVKADALYKVGKMLEALPLYEELAKKYPKDVLYEDHLAICLNADAAQVDDAVKRRKLAQRAQEAAKRAVELGDTSYVIQGMAKVDFNSLAPDRPETPARRLLHDAEKSFSSGDFAVALVKYGQAADADPNLYEAPLYAGDAAFRLPKKDVAAALKWYGRAIDVNPDRETAYRYLGDLNLWAAMVGDPAASRAKMLDDAAKANYLDAVVAEPYKPLSWQGIKKWAKLRNATLEAPKIDRPTSPTVDPNNPKKVIVHIDPAKAMDKSKDVVECWTLYSIIRADYLKERFKKEFPEERQYRHTLKEEGFALSMVVKTAKDKKIEPNDMNDSLRNLIELSNAGMLESWILISGADPDIAQDYDAYRKEHRQLLHDFLDRFIVHTSASRSQ